MHKFTQREIFNNLHLFIMKTNLKQGGGGLKFMTLTHSLSVLVPILVLFLIFINQESEVSSMLQLPKK